MQYVPLCVLSHMYNELSKLRILKLFPIILAYELVPVYPLGTQTITYLLTLSLVYTFSSIETVFTVCTHTTHCNCKMGVWIYMYTHVHKHIHTCIKEHLKFMVVAKFVV